MGVVVSGALVPALVGAAVVFAPMFVGAKVPVVIPITISVTWVVVAVVVVVGKGERGPRCKNPVVAIVIRMRGERRREPSDQNAGAE